MKYPVNGYIDFMDGQHGKPGDVVELDPTKVTDIADLQATIVDGQPVLGQAIVEASPSFVKRGKTTESEVTDAQS